jgi:hypothetical protein
MYVGGLLDGRVVVIHPLLAPKDHQLQAQHTTKHTIVVKKTCWQVACWAAFQHVP